MCPWGADPKSQTAALGFALTGLERVLFLLLHCLQLMSNKTLRVSQAACWRPTVNNSGPFHHPLSLFPDSEATEEARHKSGLSSALVTSVCRCYTPHPAVFPSQASRSPSRVGPASGPRPQPWALALHLNLQQSTFLSGFALSPPCSGCSVLGITGQ